MASVSLMRGTALPSTRGARQCSRMSAAAAPVSRRPLNVVARSFAPGKAFG